MPKSRSEPALASQRMDVVTARLVRVTPGERPSVHEVGRGLFALGRGPGVELALAGEAISRRHAQLEPSHDGGHRLIDLGSTNGTTVNELPVHAAALEPFDRIRVGPHTLIYLDPETPAEKVVELLGWGEAESSTAIAPTRRSALTARLLSLALAVPERGGELQTALDEVLEELLACTGHSRGLLLLEEEGGALRVVHARGLSADALDAPGLAACGEALHAAQAEGRPCWRPTPLDEPGRATTCCVPLDSQPVRRDGPERRRPRPGEVRGVLLLGGRAEPWEPTAEEQHLLRALTRQVAVLLAQARLERQVATDPLTGLANRGHVERLLAEELERSRATGAPVGVVLLDADDFKRVNDAFGHAMGDEVLRGLAGRLRLALRQSDVAGRWGGEEFLLVLPGADAEGAAAVADKVVHLVRASPTAEGAPRVTVSAGVAAAPGHGLEPLLLVERADRALYAAKQAGKDGHRTWSPELDAQAQDEAGGGMTTRLDRSALRLPERVEPEVVAWLDCDLLPPVPLRPGVLSLGRSRHCDVVLPHRLVSRQHVLLTVAPDGQEVLLQDCSSNGTLRNGVPVAENAALHPGDRITVGPYSLRLRRDLPETADQDDTASGQILRGRIEDGGLCAFLARLERTRATGSLVIRADDLVGELRLREGQPVSARADQTQDLEAARRLLAGRRGLYLFCRGECEEPRRLAPSTTDLLRLACPCPLHSGERGGVREPETGRAPRPERG